MVSKVFHIFLLSCCIYIAFARDNFWHGANKEFVRTIKDAQAPYPNANGACKSRVEIFGYPCEDHTVTTKDGYILSLQRIPNGKAGASSGPKIPVLLQHGLFMDGITWLLNSPDESLAYILADNGYDVWIANTRGTIYSQGHTSLSPSDSEYWEWSWDELVAYDMPANFDYVYQQSGNQQIHYVGHSLGTLIGFAAFSELNILTMVKSAAMLSPIAFMDQVSSPIARACVKVHLAEGIYEAGVVEFDPTSEKINKLLEPICNEPGVDCLDKMSSFTGPNCCLNSSASDVFLEHEPQPTSTKNLVHIAQMVRSGAITMYDYNNKDDNMKHYGTNVPPTYNITSIPEYFPIFFSYGGKDALSDVNDVLHLLNALNYQVGERQRTILGHGHLLQSPLHDLFLSQLNGITTNYPKWYYRNQCLSKLLNQKKHCRIACWMLAGKSKTLDAY